MNTTPTTPLPGKGEEGQRCNRTACQKEHSAHFVHTVMQAWYCEGCARDIESFSVRVDGVSFFPALAAERYQQESV